MANIVQREKPKFSVAIQTETYQKLINNTLGDPKVAQRFVASVSSAVGTNSALQECDTGSIITGALLGEALKLSPSPQLGYYYLVPYGNKEKGKQAQFQLGYKGYIQLAMRSGQYSDIGVIEIREGEFLGRDKFTGVHKFEFIENEDERNSKPIVGYMAYFELLNGFRKVLFMSKKDMEKHANDYSKAFNLASYEKLKAGKIPEEELWKYSSFWYKDFDQMAFKTVLRQLLSKWGILSVEMQEAYSKDMSVIHEDGSYEYIDNDGSTQEVPEAEISEPTKLSDIK